nr:uncharacterized protein LOC129057991 isoform X2 [Pongo abelii]
MGRNHPYQSPPLSPDVPEPDSSCHQNGGGDGSGGSTYAGGDQAKEVASERVETMMRTRKVGLRGADLPLGKRKGGEKIPHLGDKLKQKAKWHLWVRDTVEQTLLFSLRDKLQ